MSCVTWALKWFGFWSILLITTWQYFYLVMTLNKRCFSSISCVRLILGLRLQKNRGVKTVIQTIILWRFMKKKKHCRLLFNKVGCKDNKTWNTLQAALPKLINIWLFWSQAVHKMPVVQVILSIEVHLFTLQPFLVSA